MVLRNCESKRSVFWNFSIDFCYGKVIGFNSANPSNPIENQIIELIWTVLPAVILIFNCNAIIKNSVNGQTGNIPAGSAF